MSRALIGYTGLVGSNLLAQQGFDDCYRSTNIGDIRGKTYDEIYCAGISAVKWKANRDPETDWAGIQALLEPLSSVTAHRFVLLSTVDVFSDPVAVDESTQPQESGLHAYGLHRLKVEQFVRERFPSVVVRLPGLFGRGLKKNAVYDLLTGNNVEALDARSRFQFYNLERLSADIRNAVSLGLELVHFATEPVSVGEAAGVILGEPFTRQSGAEPVIYDMQTCHAEAWGVQGRYLYSRDQVLADLSSFADAFRRQAGQGL